MSVVLSVVVRGRLVFCCPHCGERLVRGMFSLVVRGRLVFCCSESGER